MLVTDHKMIFLLDPSFCVIQYDKVIYSAKHNIYSH